MKNSFSSFLAMSLVGCAAGPQPLYNWGTYTHQTYLMYNAPEKQRQIRRSQN